jgi:hypothetical protein
VAFPSWLCESTLRFDLPDTSLSKDIDQSALQLAHHAPSPIGGFHISLHHVGGAPALQLSSSESDGSVILDRNQMDVPGNQRIIFARLEIRYIPNSL